MPSLVEFIRTLEQYGYVVETRPNDEELSGFLTGGKLENVRAVLRASEKVCNVGILLGLFEAVPDRRRYSLLIDLFELNFEHPFARVSLFRVPYAVEKGEPETSILVAESSFFWTEMTREKFDTRISSLVALAEAASHELAARDALSKTNAFFGKLKPAKSPVKRDSFGTVDSSP